MAEWKCRYCGWTNAGKWTQCAKCGRQNESVTEYQLRAALGPQLDGILARIEEHLAAAAPKWDYMQLTSEDLEKEGGLTALGNKGWELVAMSTYSEGGTVMLVGPQIYHIKALYVFKRPQTPLPQDMQNEIEQLAAQLPPHLRAQFHLDGK